MRSTQALPTDDRGLQVLFTKVGLAAIGLCVVVTLLFQTVIGLGTRLETYVLLALWIALPGMWLGWVLATQNKTRYFLANDAIEVQTKLLTGVRKELFRYDTILGLTVRQDFWGKRYDYGDITLDTPQLGKHIVLKYIARPNAQVESLKSAVAAHDNLRLRHRA